MKNQRKTLPVFHRKALTLAVAGCFCFGQVLANPLGPQVVAGSAGFATQGNTLTVTNTPGAIINWQNFSIGANEVTRFNQASAASSVLNRVVTSNPSQLLGTLQSNGRVFLVNPAGILVGAGAVVDTAGFVASTLNLSNADFLAGKYNFTETAGAGKVENLGTITTPSGGSVYLVGSQVENHGIINAPNGEVLLAAGKTIQLIDTATPGVRVEITADKEQALNLGQVLADSGRIGVVGAIVRNSGKISASSVTSEGGRVFLKATQDTYVEKGGSIEATGTKGGQVEVLGNRVALTDQASLDVSGTQGGGTILVGGDYQGKNAEVQNANISYVGKDVSLKADATQQGDGGKVVVWADDITRFYGDVKARGGSGGGNGGFVEASGHRYLDYQGRADTLAPKGTAGTLLLDPSDIIISNAADVLSGGAFAGSVFDGVAGTATLSWATINTQTGTLAIRTSNGTGGAGDININASGTVTGPSTLNLLANNNINFASGVAVSGGSFNLIAGWNNTGFAVTSGTGNLNFAASSSLTATGSAVANVGNNITQATGSFVQAPTIELSAGNTISLTTKAPGTSTTTFNFGGGTLQPTGVSISHTGKASLNSVALATNSPFQFVASGDLSETPAINTGTSDLTLTSTSGTLTTTGILQGQNIALTANNDYSTSQNITATNNLTIDLTGANSMFTRGLSTTIKGNIATTIKADKMNNSSAGAIGNGAGSTVTLLPKTANRAIALGTGTGGSDSTSLELSTNELSQITADTLRIGDTSSGALTVGAAIAPPSVTNLVLGSGSTIGQVSAGTISIANLGVSSSGAVDLSTATNLVTGNIAASVTSGNLSFKNANSFAVDTVGGTSGISVPSGNVTLVAGGLNKTLTIGQTVTANTGNVTYIADNLAHNAFTTTSGSAGKYAEVIPFTAATVIEFSNIADAAGFLRLSAAELNRFSTPMLKVGNNTNTGGIAVKDVVAPTAFTTLSLITGGAITQDAGKTITIANLNADGYTGVTLNEANSVTKLGGHTTTGNFAYTDATGITVAQTDPSGSNGIVSGSGNISLKATTGNIDRNGSAVVGTGSSGAFSAEATTGGISLVGNGSALNTNALTASGDITFKNPAPLTIKGSVTSSGGNIDLSSQGALTVDGLGSVQATGAAKNITLTAGSAGSSSTADVVTINSSTVSATGNIFLNGYSVGGTNVPTVRTTVSIYTAPPSTPPTLDQCVANPSLSGCSSVLPTLATCTTAPTTAGCSAVLPTLAACTTAPTTAGCSAVLPTLATCTATPTTAGCSAVLPTLAACTLAPTTAGCSVVLPTLANCTATPTIAGCSSVLPSLATCTATPTAAGCSAVLPSLATCTATPTAAGCSAVLPSLATCTATPTAAGCSAVLPTLATCTITPTAAGCSAVLPTLATCTATPTASGCSAVLPTLATCTTTPTAAGCSAVLPTLATCTTTPTAAGCSAVLPTGVLSPVVATPVEASQSQAVTALSSATTVNRVTTVVSPTVPVTTPVLPAFSGGIGASTTYAGGVTGGETPNTFGAAEDTSGSASTPSASGMSVIPKGKDANDKNDRKPGQCLS